MPTIPLYFLPLFLAGIILVASVVINLKLRKKHNNVINLEREDDDKIIQEMRKRCKVHTFSTKEEARECLKEVSMR